LSKKNIHAPRKICKEWVGDSSRFRNVAFGN
jgi:hypothetical protein